MKEVQTGEYNFEGEEWYKVTASAKDFINYLLNLNVEERPSAEECLKHEWLKNADVFKEEGKKIDP